MLRPFWLNKLKAAWEKRPIIWLSGVRRSGKTTIAKMMPDTHFLNCDLPSTARELTDPEYFLKSQQSGSIIVFDEIHRLEDPTTVLKICADEFPTLKILATGSSTLTASSKFKDTLTGRKIDIFLPPVIWPETKNEFNIKNLNLRLQRGGLPEHLLMENYTPEYYSEWIDSFFARDIQELFSVRNRSGFLNLFRLLLRRSGSTVEYSSLSQESGISRPTLSSYIEALSIANAIFLLPPFHGGGKRELIKRPKVYAFDTGFVAFENGWDTLRESEQGTLWEHLVLDSLRTTFSDERIHYWCDKTGREIDFVIKQGREAITIECKLNPDKFDTDNLQNFRTLYESGKNFVVSPHIKKPYTRNIKNLEIIFCDIDHIMLTENL
ncbi:MAG: ATP-binding protein [Fibrobacteres bacterium]|nr:ATP-binding protein [Fibrobacterota bacterium]